MHEAPAFTVAAVARRLGVAPSTLRSWERRYGVGPSGREAGSRRRYTALDIARLEHMRRLTLDGVAPVDAARLALGVPADAGADASRVPRPPARPLAYVDDEQARPGYGGNVVAIPEGNARARGLARAALTLDCEAARDVIDGALAEHGVIATWDAVVAPVLRGIGDRWAATGEGVEVEHVLSEAVLRSLRAVCDLARTPRSRPILLACPDSEGHVLPLHALAAALAERGVSTRVLGGGLPADALAQAVRRTGAAAVFLHAQQPATATRSSLEAVPATRPPAAVLAGGAGWEPARLPAHVTYAHDLGEAVHLVQLACGLG